MKNDLVENVEPIIKSHIKEFFTSYPKERSKDSGNYSKKYTWENEGQKVNL